MMIAIDKLYMNKMPKSCKECPLTYLDSGDDAYSYFGAYERRCVIDDSCVDGMVSERAYDCPLVEAIPKSEYEARLKSDIVAILTDIQMEIEEKEQYYQDKFLEQKNAVHDAAMGGRMFGCGECKEIIQEKINGLNKENK